MTYMDNIKESLNLYRMMMAALLSIVLGIFWTVLTNINKWDNRITISVLLFGLVISIVNAVIFYEYNELKNKLKYLPQSLLPI